MRWRFDSFLAGFFVCFLPILVVYYPLLMFQEDLTTSGTLPPVAFWMANLALVIPGFLLLRGVIRY
jgi:lipopolysaccharide export system permease protein